MAANKSTKKEVSYRHREDAEWLTIEICEKYRKKAEMLGIANVNNIGARRKLQMELQQRCDITELQAINIVNGYNASDYVVYYERMKNHKDNEVADAEYLEWLAHKINSEHLTIDDFEIEE